MAYEPRVIELTCQVDSGDHPEQVEAYNALVTEVEALVDKPEYADLRIGLLNEVL